MLNDLVAKSGRLGSERSYCQVQWSGNFQTV